MTTALRLNAAFTPRNTSPTEAEVINQHAVLIDATHELGYAESTSDYAILATPTAITGLSIDVEPWDNAVIVNLVVPTIQLVATAGTLAFMIVDDDTNAILNTAFGSALDLSAFAVTTTWAPPVNLAVRLPPSSSIRHMRAEAFANAVSTFVIESNFASILPSPYFLQAVGL